MHPRHKTLTICQAGKKGQMGTMGKFAQVRSTVIKRLGHRKWSVINAPKTFSFNSLTNQTEKYYISEN